MEEWPLVKGFKFISDDELDKNPGKFGNFCESPAHADVKLDLMQRSFDASMLAMDRGQERIGPM